MKRTNKENLFIWGLIIILLAISIGITYLIGTSNLPDWVKFWLLS